MWLGLLLYLDHDQQNHDRCNAERTVCLFTRSMSLRIVRSVSRGIKLWSIAEPKVLTWCQFTPTRSRLLFPASLFSRTFILTFTFGWVWMTWILKVDTPGATVRRTYFHFQIEKKTLWDIQAENLLLSICKNFF